MIFDLPHTSTSEISRKLISIREEGVGAASGRVLTLIVVLNAGDDLERIVTSVTDASREHPSRVLVLVNGSPDSADSVAAGSNDPAVLNADSVVDAQIRVGGDAGASEIIIMHLTGPVAGHMEAVVTPLLLPDTPIVAWWPFAAPINPAADPIGRIAQRRITDALNDPPEDSIYRRRNHYRPGDSDISWSRITQWRGVVASTLDQPPHEAVEDARIYGPAGSPSVDLAAGWLADRLGVNIVRFSTEDPAIPLDAKGRPCVPVTKVELLRQNSTITLQVVDAHTYSVSMDGRAPALVALSRRSLADCLAEELRHLAPDQAYSRALRGLNRVRYVDTFTEEVLGD